MKEKTLHLTRAALIAALYVILTFLAQIFGLASGAIQFRLSEALTCMPLFYKEAIPGLWIGCILANLLTGCAMWDIVFGSVATLLGALGTYYIGRKKPALGPVSVSYTHLRAHETGRNLVCRLLLEKKKKRMP